MIGFLRCARAALALSFSSMLVSAQAAPPGPLAPHSVPELGLQVHVESKPAWATQLATHGRPVFGAQSPEGYAAPAVMTFMSFPKERVPDAGLNTMASTAIRTGSRNFGLNKRQAEALQVKPASYGVLKGYESVFPGRGQGTNLDVVVFVGQAPQRFPVVLTLYTQRGKLAQLDGLRQAAWSKITYLDK